MRRLKNVFWNAKTERHEVAIAEGKYRRRQISRGAIAVGKYHEVNIAQQISPKANIAIGINRKKIG
jgi:hypothetical protein